MGWLAALAPLVAAATPGGPAAVAVPVATVWSSPAAAVAFGQPPSWPRLTTARRRMLVGRIETQALLGDKVKVLDSRPVGWTKIVVLDQPSPKDAAGYPGWVRSVALDLPNDSRFTVVVTARTAEVRTANTGTFEVSYGTRFSVVRPGVLRTTVLFPGRGQGTIASSAVRRRPAATPTAIVADARRFVGVRYLWGGTSAYGWDCSGLVHLVFRTHGITIPRDADAQAAGGRPVARAALRPGDLVFYGVTPVHHVALYVGGGRMLEAPNSASRVRIVPLRLADYAGARRYLP